MDTTNANLMANLSRQRFPALLWALGGFMYRGYEAIAIIRDHLPKTDPEDFEVFESWLTHLTTRECHAQESDPALPVMSDQLRSELIRGKHSRWATELPTPKLHAILHATDAVTQFQQRLCELLTEFADDVDQRYGFVRATASLNGVFKIANGQQVTPDSHAADVRRAVRNLDKWLKDKTITGQFSFAALNAA